jgi:hypothetical protein
VTRFHLEPNFDSIQVKKVENLFVQVGRGMLDEGISGLTWEAQARALIRQLTHDPNGFGVGTGEPGAHFLGHA